jgi:beta-lactamase class A
MLQAAIDSVVNAAPGVDWAISIRDAGGNELAGRNADTAMEIASVGKLLLLVEVARQGVEGTLESDELLGRDPALMVADSGIWQHLRVDALPIHDLCVLVASVSDNLATNVLLKRVGLQSIRDIAASLGLVNTLLLDYVRDHRTPGDAPTLATGSASELSLLMNRMASGELLSRAVSEQVHAWLATGVDLSMVASAFGLDPLAHGTSDRKPLIRNKTGTDAGVRADAGVAGRDRTWLSYAVIANWSTSDAGATDTALAGMNSIGKSLRYVLENGYIPPF